MMQQIENEHSSCNYWCWFIVGCNENYLSLG